jgi:hypothetical protein
MVFSGQVGQLQNSPSENGLTFDSSRKVKSISPYGGQGRRTALALMGDKEERRIDSEQLISSQLHVTTKKEK